MKFHLLLVSLVLCASSAVAQIGPPPAIFKLGPPDTTTVIAIAEINAPANSDVSVTITLCDGTITTFTVEAGDTRDDIEVPEGASIQSTWTNNDWTLTNSGFGDCEDPCDCT